MTRTHHLIGAKQLAKMKASAFLINMARGPVVHEQALVDALLEDKIAGAALDVFEFEPEVHPALLQMPNVCPDAPISVVGTQQSRRAARRLCAEKCRRRAARQAAHFAGQLSAKASGKGTGLTLGLDCAIKAKTA